MEGFWDVKNISTATGVIENLCNIDEFAQGRWRSFTGQETPAAPAPLVPSVSVHLRPVRITGNVKNVVMEMPVRGRIGVKKSACLVFAGAAGGGFLASGCAQGSHMQLAAGVLFMAFGIWLGKTSDEATTITSTTTAELFTDDGK